MTKKVQEIITAKEYKLLMNATRGNISIRANTKSNMLRVFCILYYTGMRLNEVQNLRIFNIRELIENGMTVVVLSKTNSERKLFISDNFKTELIQLFDFNREDDLNRVITKGSSKQKRTGINNITFIGMVNKSIQTILGEKFSSHCFRRGLLTQMGSKSINPKIIAKFVGHLNVKTTMAYITPTDEDVMNSMIR